MQQQVPALAGTRPSLAYPGWLAYVPIEQRKEGVRQRPWTHPAGTVMHPAGTLARFNGVLSGGSGQPRTVRKDAVPPQKDHRAFPEHFADLVTASGLSTRDIEKRSGVGKSTISDWKNGTALPQDAGQLAKVAQALMEATGDAVSPQSGTRRVQTLMALLKDAKEERDARSARPPGRPASQAPGLAAERRAQSAAAAADASKAVMSLRNLKTMPDWKREVASYSGARVPEITAEEARDQAAWERQRLDLLSEIELATLVIDDGKLRGRLKEAVQMLKLWDGPMSHARQSETQTRFIVADDVLEALGAYRRGEPLPATSPEYGNTKEFVEVYIEERELNSGL